MERLVEKYPLEQPVQIRLGADGWVQGRVVGHQHPALWVQTEDGRFWFVTNRQRIRPAGGTGEKKSHG